MKFVYLLFILFIISDLILPQELSRQIKIAEDISRLALTDQSGYKMLEELCKIGHRLSGSENSLKAIYWAKEKMDRIGFDTVWLQPVMVPHWERGNPEEAILSGKSGKRSLSIAALGGSVATPDEGITARVLEVKSFDELRTRKDEAKGKIIFFSRPLDQGLVNTFAGYGGAVNQRGSGAIMSAAYGGVGAIVRSVTTLKDNNPHTGAMYYVDTLPKVPGVAIGYQDADYLSSMLKEDPELKVTLKLNCRSFPDAQSYNIISEIRGSEYPEEIILVGGHFDSWDLSCGANDDGAGCIQSLEVLELFKKMDIKPKRTIRCVFFINEENGIRGALEYAQYSDSLKLNHITAIESDRGAFTPKGFSVDTDSLILQKLQQWLPVLNKTGIEFVRAGGSGVDIHQIKDVKAKIGYVPDNQRYMDVQHSKNDNFESVHPREMQLGTAAMAVLVYLISEEGL
jgi:carboxypeptidase Q